MNAKPILSSRLMVCNEENRTAPNQTESCDSLSFQNNSNQNQTYQHTTILLSYLCTLQIEYKMTSGTERMRWINCPLHIHCKRMNWKQKRKMWFAITTEFQNQLKMYDTNILNFRRLNGADIIHTLLDALRIGPTDTIIIITIRNETSIA